MSCRTSAPWSPRCFSHTLCRCARPRPVHIEIPLDVLELPADGLDLCPVRCPGRRPGAGRGGRGCGPAGRGAPAAGPRRWRCPGAAALRELAERLQAPVALTTNARGLLQPDHPLLLDGVQSSAHGRALFAEADVVLAVGTELGETDYDFFGLGPCRSRCR